MRYAKLSIPDGVPFSVDPSSSHISFADLNKLLGQFRTADEIATLIASYDIKGKRLRFNECPLVHLARLATGQAIAVQASIWWTVFPYQVFTLPMVVMEFVQNFDEGEYPELVIQ